MRVDVDSIVQPIYKWTSIMPTGVFVHSSEEMEHVFALKFKNEPKKKNK